MSVDTLTKRWIRNASDERAVANGCRFDEERGQWVVDWLAKYLRLYEGEWAGQPFQCTPWQYDSVMRLFGWVKHSNRWGREIRRFREGGIWIPKKNGKSPLLAALGLYLLCGDGEQGQKVFFGAVDGQQARDNVGKHAVEMLMSSDELMAECTINRTTMQLTHEPTRSILKPLSSANERTERSKEGLNGSILIDETHVVNRSFMRRLSRAGISRSEPLLLEVSTAGDDPDGYGYGRWEYGRKVADGTIEHESFFFTEHAAPQELSEEELDADPVKWGKLANPGWGMTVGEEEFLGDYKSSRPRPLDFADFRKYRLNIWQHTAAPWLSLAAWDKCYSDLTLADFEGEECWLGLDMSITRDMTAVIAVFRRGDEYWQFPWMWLPKETARRYEGLASWEAWAAEGDLILLEGDLIREEPIKAVLADLDKRFRVVEMRFDKSFAVGVWTWAEEELGWTCADFTQSYTQYSPNVDYYDKMITAGTLHHNGNRVLRWMAGHATVREDNHNRRIVVKPERADHKKIDGLVAGIMALSGAVADEGAEFVLYVGD